MAIKRHIEVSDGDKTSGKTNAPDDILVPLLPREKAKTSDVKGYKQSYQNEQEAKAGEGISTGAYLPQDMTVKLVRADSSNLELFFSIFYSLFLTLCGITSGAWIATPPDGTFSPWGKFATYAYGVLAIIFIALWIYLRISMYKKGVIVSNEFFKSNQIKTEEK